MTDIEVTLNAWEQSYVSVLAVQGESSGRTLNVTLIDRTSLTDGSYNAVSINRPIDLTGVTARLYCAKPDGTVTFSDGTVTDAKDGKASFVLPYQATTNAGDVACQILLTKADNSSIKAIGLHLNVQESQLDGAVESTGEYSALVTALNKADAAAAQTEKNEKDSETAVTNANQAITTVTANESTRQNNEQTRQTNESTRQSDEDARKTAETARVNAESTRQMDETTRQTQEQSRKDAESARATAETTRESNESTRKSNEAARQTAESTRASEEDARKTNETARRTAESARAAAESARASAESARVTDEKSRVDAESSRVSAESARVTAENKRQTDTQTAISGTNTAATGANTAADRANTAAKNAEDAIAGQLDPAIDARIAAKTGVTGGVAGYDSTQTSLSEKANFTKVTGSPDFNALTTTGLYGIATSSYTNGPSGIKNWGLLIVDKSGNGTQTFLPDGTLFTAYRRSGTGSGTWNAWNDEEWVTPSQISAWTAKAEKSDIPTSLPANGGNAATLNGHGTDNGPNSVLLSGRKSGTTIGANSTAEGSDTTANNGCSHAEGSGTTASNYASHAEGSGTTASDPCSHAEGNYTTASNYASHAEGASTTASGSHSHAEGCITTANAYCSHVQGQCNKGLSGDAGSFSATSDAMVIGNGTFDISTATTNYSNCFRVTFDGKVYGLSSFNSSGADYAEFFEWLDENPNKEDRVGHFVALDGEKIKYANDGDYIVGIVSGAPAIIGDHPSESWSERWVKDVFGRIQTEEVDVPETQEKDKDGNVIRTVPAHTETRFKVNPDYDPTKEADYLNREKRPEWATIGMLGKLVCIDDGTCEVNGYCKPSNGIATKAATGYRVLARLDSTHIKVLFK